MPRRWFTTCVLLIVLAFSSLAYAQTGRPIPPGIRAADRAQQQADQNIEPPLSFPQKLNAADVTKQADDLLALAQQVHMDAIQATHGLMAKDLKDKLKRMEKLSKRLRDELTP